MRSMSDLIEWQIRQADDGSWVANGTPVTMAVEAGGQIFMRRAFNVGSGSGSETRWLVGRLDGVSIYVMTDSPSASPKILMTKRELYPDGDGNRNLG